MAPLLHAVLLVTKDTPKLNSLDTRDSVACLPSKENLMDISRLQLRTAAPVSRTSSLPLGLQTPVTLDPISAVPQTIAPLLGDAGDITAGMFGHFAAAWENSLNQFLTDDPVFRA
jgi:hypothetical protein